MEVQARSIRDYDCVVARTGAAQDVTRPGGFHVACKPPPESPVGAPVEKTFHASLAFTGCAVAGFEKHTPGCIFRPLAEPDSPPPAPVVMVPERSWPSGVKPGGTAEVNWCA